jgi:hypothetical protein
MGIYQHSLRIQAHPKPRAPKIFPYKWDLLGFRSRSTFGRSLPAFPAS